jgi:hypothetical protein
VFDGSIAVVALASGTKLLCGLRALDARTAETIAELREEPESRLEAIRFARLAGDFRVACATNRSGLQRPLTWNPSTGERFDLPVDVLKGAIASVDWSTNGQQLLLWQVYQAVDRFYLYDITSDAITELQFPSGAYSGIYFGPDDEVFAEWQNSTQLND